MTKQGDIQREPDENFEQAIDEMAWEGSVSTIEELEKIVNRILATLPRLDRLKLRQEMEDMAVSLKQSPTTDDLSGGLAFAQGYKDRLAEIYTMALREYKTRQRCSDMLLDAMNIVSKASSADKRRGEATMRYPMMLINLEASEVFLKEVEHIIQNIKSVMEAVSRQVSIMQLQLQLGEVRKEHKEHKENNSEAEELQRRSGPKETSWDDDF